MEDRISHLRDGSDCRSDPRPQVSVDEPTLRFIDAWQALYDWSNETGYAHELAPKQLRREANDALIALIVHVNLHREEKDSDEN